MVVLRANRPENEVVHSPALVTQQTNVATKTGSTVISVHCKQKDAALLLKVVEG